MKKIPAVLWPISGICFLLILSAFFLFNRTYLSTIPSETHRHISKGSLKISDINFSQDCNDGQEKWNLKAKEASFSEKNNTVLLRHALLTIDNSGEDLFMIKGKEGSYLKGEGKITLKGDVQGKSLSGYQMHTKQLDYNQEKELVKTNDHVKITGPSFEIVADGLFFNIKEKRFVIKGNVCTTVMAEEPRK